MTNQQAFHRNCGGCHDAVVKARPDLTPPPPTSKKRCLSQKIAGLSEFTFGGFFVLGKRPQITVANVISRDPHAAQSLRSAILGLNPGLLIP